MRNISLHFIAFVALIVGNFTTAASAAPKIVVFGDSLVAGYQLPVDQGFVGQLDAALKKADQQVELIGAGVSGDTTSGGLARLDWSVPDDADGVILELGANDALRGLPVETTRKNLAAMIDRFKEKGVTVLLVGMLAPPNMGEAYGKKFNTIFAELAEEKGTLFYPFFLDGVAADPSLNLGDGIHPNEKGIAIIVERIMPMVRQLIDRAAATD